MVALLVAGDRRGLEAAYATYADRIHDYAHGMLHRTDPDAAADVTQDTFLIAFAKAGDLRDPQRFRSWLYAIARNECLRVLRARGRTQALDAEIADRAGEEGDMSTALTDADLSALVRGAADGLAPKDREVFDLGLRHDLAAPEIAAALGVSDNAAHAMLSRVRAQLDRALGAFVVARSGRRSCPGLESVLDDWDGTFTPLWRKRIARHVDGCPTCRSLRSRELSPAALLSAMPLMAAPALRHTRLVSADLSLARARAAQAGEFTAPGGFPAPSDAAESRRRGGVLVVAAVLLLLGGVVSSYLAITVDQPVETLPMQGPTLSPAMPEVSYGVQPGITVSPPETAPTSLPPTPTPAPTTESTPSPTPTAVPAEPTPPSSPRPPPPVETTTETPPPAPGTLEINPRELTLAPGETGWVRLTAEGGPVSWSADPDVASEPHVDLSVLEGTLAEGDTSSVGITVAERVPDRVTQLNVVFEPGAQRVAIAVNRPAR